MEGRKIGFNFAPRSQGLGLIPAGSL
jgi:hypothetical protein